MAETPRAGGRPRTYDDQPREGAPRPPEGPSTSGSPGVVGPTGHSHARGDSQGAGRIADDTGPQVPTTLEKHPDELAPPFEETPMGPPPSGPGTDPWPGARAQQARHMHDHGMYRDKIAVSDPAATPLGTDSEAAGDHVPEGSVEPAAPMDAPAANNHTPYGHARGEVPQRSTAIVWTLGAVVGAVVLGLVILAMT